MKNKLLLFFIFVWASADAQTFEKTIDYPGTLNNVVSLNIDSNSNIYITGLKSSFVSGPLQRKRSTFFLKLDQTSNVIINKTINSNYIIPSIDTSFNDFLTTVSFLENNQLIHIGHLRASAPQNYASMAYITDLSYNLLKKNISDTILDSTVLYVDYTKYKKSIFAYGLAYSLLNGNLFGITLKLDSSKSIESSGPIFSISNGILSSQIIGMLFDKNENQYIVTWGYYGPPNFFTSPLQILKLDSNFNLNKLRYVESPSVDPLIDAPINSTYGGVEWLNDSTFLFATAGRSQQNQKGDVHLFIYDTSLTQLNYKKIEASDSLLEADIRSLVYDVNSDCFYFGVTQRFENANTSVLNSRDSTHFRLIKFDKDLNILFDRQYRRNKSMKLNKVTIDAQGNVIMAGYTQDLSQPFNETSIYILKVDSNGNFTRTSLMDHNQIDPLDYAIFPNPVKEQATFRQYNQQVSYQLNLFDINGRLVKEIQIVNSETTLNLTELKSGTYLYQLLDENGKRGSGKLVKE